MGFLGLGSSKSSITPVAGIDPNYKKAVQQQEAAAQQFRQGLPQFKQDQMSMATQQGKLDLANSMAQSRSNLSSRGLLYGGMRQGAEAKNRAGLASDLSKSQTDINKTADDQANQLDYSAIQQAQGLRDLEQDRFNAMYGGEAQSNQMQQQAFTGLLGGGAAIGGMALANSLKSQK